MTLERGWCYWQVGEAWGSGLKGRSKDLGCLVGGRCRGLEGVRGSRGWTTQRLMCQSQEVTLQLQATPHSINQGHCRPAMMAGDCVPLASTTTFPGIFFLVCLQFRWATRETLARCRRQERPRSSWQPTHVTAGHD